MTWNGLLCQIRFCLWDRLKAKYKRHNRLYILVTVLDIGADSLKKMPRSSLLNNTALFASWKRKAPNTITAESRRLTVKQHNYDNDISLTELLPTVTHLFGPFYVLIRILRCCTNYCNFFRLLQKGSNILFCFHNVRLLFLAFFIYLLRPAI